MFAISNLLTAIAVCLNIGITICSWLVLIRALISWVNPDPFNPIVQFLYKTTEPLLIPFRRIIPAYKIGIDISPVLAIIVLLFAKYFIVQTLFDLAMRIR